MTGPGTVTSAPAGINCTESGGTCSATFLSGQSVTLTGAFETAHDTISWGGADCSGSGTKCTVEMSQDRVATTDFAYRSKVRAKVSEGGGSFLFGHDGKLITPGYEAFRTYSSLFEPGATVTVIAIPDERYRFNAWQSCPGTAVGVQVNGTPRAGCRVVVGVTPEVTEVLARFVSTS